MQLNDSTLFRQQAFIDSDWRDARAFIDSDWRDARAAAMSSP
ncbi:hypothetical protein LTSEJOH_3228 [Salmonella enterica subsp. enterica serovar Johannesburg str. S5-703]|nr:hypothetical protein LTSEJOH_3228 [Salmonella enterica subsp. enterica serovar Johannesburg str. S5-703]